MEVYEAIEETMLDRKEETMEQLIKWRRELHQIPELDDNVEKTYAYLLNNIPSCLKEVCSVIKGNLCVYVSYQQERTVAIRADIDALPIHEHTNTDYASCHQGKMHACGHDGHMAMALGVLHELAHSQQSLPVNVLCIFQPSEETSGGAKRICETGILQKYHVCAVLGIHLWPMVPSHQLYSKPSLLFYASCEIDVHIQGRSAHCGKMEEGNDALKTGIHLYETMTYQQEHRLSFIGQIESGEGRNIVPSHCDMKGTLRSSTWKDLLKMKEEWKQQEQKGNIHCVFSEGYPPLYNDAHLYTQAAQVCSIEEVKQAFYLSDDFAYYGSYAPSLYLLLGCNGEHPLHSDQFDFDESCLKTGVSTYMKILQSF